MSEEEKEEKLETFEGDDVLREREKLKALGLEDASEDAFGRITNVDPEKAKKMEEEEKEKKSRTFVGFE